MRPLCPAGANAAGLRAFAHPLDHLTLDFTVSGRSSRLVRNIARRALQLSLPLQLAFLANAPALAIDAAQSTVWSVDAAAFLPILSGTYAFQDGIHTANLVEVGGTANTSLATNATLGAAPQPVSAGYSVVSAYALSTGGGQAAMAGSGGFGAAAVGLFEAATSSSINASGSQSATASVTSSSGTTANSDFATTAEALLTANSATVFDFEANASGSAQAIHAAGSTPDAVGFVYLEPTPGTATFAPSNGVTSLSAAGGQPAAGLELALTSNFALATALPAAGLQLESALADVPAFSTLAVTTGGNLEQSFVAGQAGFQATTTAVNANAMQLFLASDQQAKLGILLSGENAEIAAGQDGASGILAAAQGTSQTDMALEIAGSNSGITSLGVGGFGINLIAKAGDGAATNAVTLSGAGTNIDAAGANAAAILQIADGGTSAKSKLVVSGDNSRVHAGGSNSPASVLVANAVEEATSSLLVSGSGATLSSTGDGAAAGLLLSHGKKASATIDIAGAAAAATTTGAGSSAFTTIVSAAELATVSFSMSGAGSQIETTGQQSAAAVIMANAPSVDIRTVISGSDATVTTSGDYAPGFVMAALGGGHAHASLDLSGQGSRIETTGDYATGVHLAAAAPDANGSATTALTLAGHAAIATAGDHATGASLVARKTSVKLSGSGSRISTEGVDSAAVISIASEAVVDLAAGSELAAMGAGAMALVLKGEGTANVKAAGSITASGDAVWADNALSLSNAGLIRSTTGTAIHLDHGDIESSGAILGVVGVIATQDGDEAVDLTTTGSILSSSGYAGTAMLFMGNADDRLAIGPRASISGKIDLGSSVSGSGSDSVVALPGTSLDLQMERVPASVISSTGVHVQTSDPLRVVIADMSHVLGATAATTDAAWQMSKGNDLQPPDKACGAHLETRVLNRHAQASSSSLVANYEGVSNGLLVRASFADCGRNELGFLAGYIKQEGDSFSASEVNSQAFFAGLDHRYALDDASWLEASALLGQTSGDETRWIVNNRLDEGHELARGEFDNLFSAARLSLKRNWTQGDLLLTGYANAGLLGLGQLDLAETGAASAVDLQHNAELFGRFEAGLHLRMSDVNIQELAIVPEANIGVSWSDVLHEGRQDVQLANGDGVASVKRGSSHQLGYDAAIALGITHPSMPGSLRLSASYQGGSHGSSAWSLSTGWGIPLGSTQP